MDRIDDCLGSHPVTDQLSLQLSSMQTENKKERRAGKKERPERQSRKERETMDENMDKNNIVPVEKPAFELRVAGIKGLGLFAARNIEAGERIIQEAPLFILPQEHITNAAVIESFINLRPKQRAAYLNLSFHATCNANQGIEAGKTSVIENSAEILVNVEDLDITTCGNKSPTKQHDRHGYDSSMQPFPPRGLHGDPDMGNSCKLPNADGGSGDPSPKEQYKLELQESEATIPSSSVHEPRVDFSIQGSDKTAMIWDVDDLEGALVANSASSNSESSTFDSSDDQHQDYEADEREVTQTLAAHIVNIWRTNSYMLDDGITLDDAGIGLTAARLNHSCIPNVYTAYNSVSGHMTVQAIKTIAAGDELCTAYINSVGKLRSERRAQLYMWGFECTCIACADGRDDSRCRKIKLLKVKVDEVRTKLSENPTGMPVAQIEQTVDDLLELATLMSDEGLLGPDLADIYFGASRCCMLASRHEEAGAFQSLGFGVLLRDYGIDSPICSAALQAGDADEA